MVKQRANRQPGDDDEGEEAERSDTEDMGVQDEDDHDGTETEDNPSW